MDVCDDDDCHICGCVCDDDCHMCVYQEDAQEEFGWKLVHGDVFRPPRKGMLLSVMAGTGTQIFFMTLITLGKACWPSSFSLVSLMVFTEGGREEC